MAQEPGALSGRDAAEPTTESAGQPDDAARLHRDIAQTRASMSHTLDAIQERITPSNVVNRTMESVAATTKLRMRELGDKASSTAAYLANRSSARRERLMRAGRQNPGAAVLLGVATTWIVTGALMGRRRQTQRPTPSSRKPVRY
ncbi:MAG: DUF3618 domain-containing protein [Vicinamibacterales bacterium]